MLLRRHLAWIICLLLVIAGVPADEASHRILLQPGFEKCVVECSRAGLEDPRKQVPSSKSCSESCQNRTREDTVGALDKNSSSLAAAGKLPSIQQKRKRLPRDEGRKCPHSSGQVDWYPSNTEATFHQYGNSSSWYLTVSWTPLNDSSGNWTEILVRFIAIYNRSTSHLGPVHCIKLSKNRTSLNINISEYGWNYPDSFLVLVSALPYHKEEAVMKIFHPTVPSTTASTTVSQTTTRKSACTPDGKPDDVIWYPKRVSADFSNASGQWKANISWTPLTEPISWAGYKIQISIRDVPQSITEDFLCFTVPKNQTFFIVDSALGWSYPNPIYVNVTKVPYPKTGAHNRTITMTMTTFSAPVEKGDVPGTLHPSKDTSPHHIIILLAGALVGSLFVVGFFVVWCHKKQRTVSPARPSSPLTSFRYHAFIIYNDEDADWVEGTLLPTLENKNNFKCCYHRRDFIAGKVYLDSMVESVYNSYKVIAVASSNFFSSTNCDFELNHALSRLANHGDDCLIVLKLDDSVDARLPIELIRRSYIDLTNENERRNWESKVVNILQEAILDGASETDSGFIMDNNNGSLSEISVNIESTDGMDDIDTVL